MLDEILAGYVEEDLGLQALIARGLPDVVPTPPQVAVLPAPPAPDPLLADRPTLDELNRRYAERILRDLGGNKTRAAEALGIDRKTLSRLVGPEE